MNEPRLKFPLGQTVPVLYDKIKYAVTAFRTHEFAAEELASPVRLGGGRIVDAALHDFPAALEELARQGLVDILPNGRVRVTDRFETGPQPITVFVRPTLADLLERHRQDAGLQTGAYATLYVIENGVRDLIAGVLTRVERNWWGLLPRDAQEEARKNFNSDPEAKMRTWEDLSPRERLYYVMFDSLRKIVTAQWEHFKRIIDSQPAFGGELEKVEPIRHALAHTRPLSPAQVARLEVCADYVARVAKVADRELQGAR